MEQYIEVMKYFLEKEKFSELTNKMLNEINRKYRKIKADKAVKLVEFNMSIMVVIGVEKARGCKKEDMKKRIDWYKLGPESELMERTYDKLEADYGEYIKIIENGVKKDREGKK